MNKNNDLLQSEQMEGMYLTFVLDNVGYGIEISHIIEIIGIQNVTYVPDMPDYVIGVINLRGNVIPVIDVRVRFNMPCREFDERTCIIVVSINDRLTGLVVDKVNEVISILPEQIEACPRLGAGGTGYLKGIGKVDDQVKILIEAELLVGNIDCNPGQELDVAV